MTQTGGIDRLIRSEVVALMGYGLQSPKRPSGGIIRLAANENPYGCSPRVQRALAGYAHLNLYPDATQGELKELLSGYAGIGEEYIVASNGSDELIDHVTRLFVGSGDEVIDCIPSFGIFRIRTQIAGGVLVEVPRDGEFAVDVAAVKAAITKMTKLIVLVNPNNPTGTLISQKDILEIVDTGLPVLVDEAYAEFSGATLTSLVSRYENLMVLRTFSKWAGLAGIRIGYGIFPPNIASYLMKIKAPFNVNAVATIAVRESLKDIAYLQRNVKAILNEKERLFAELGKLNFLKPFPSWANFIFCTVLKGRADEIQQELQKRSIAIRHFDIPGGGSGIRISVGKPEHTDALIKALREVGEELVG